MALFDPPSISSGDDPLVIQGGICGNSLEVWMGKLIGKSWIVHWCPLLCLILRGYGFYECIWWFELTLWMISRCVKWLFMDKMTLKNPGGGERCWNVFFFLSPSGNCYIAVVYMAHLYTIYLQKILPILNRRFSIAISNSQRVNIIVQMRHVIESCYWWMGMVINPWVC